MIKSIEEKLEIAINGIMNDHDIPQDLKDKFSKIREESKKEQQIIDEAYKNYWRQTISNTEDSASLEELDGMCLGTGEIKKVYRQYAPKEFINKCKTDPEFSEKWGLKIEERELSIDEREKLAIDKYPRLNEIPYGALVDMQPFTNEFGDSLNIPTRLITITYKEQKIESYENYEN